MIRQKRQEEPKRHAWKLLTDIERISDNLLSLALESHDKDFRTKTLIVFNYSGVIMEGKKEEKPTGISHLPDHMDLVRDAEEFADEMGKIRDRAVRNTLIEKQEYMVKKLSADCGALLSNPIKSIHRL